MTRSHVCHKSVHDMHHTSLFLTRRQDQISQCPRTQNAPRLPRGVLRSAMAKSRVAICVCMHVCVCVYMYIHTHIYVYIMYICIYIRNAPQASIGVPSSAMVSCVLLREQRCRVSDKPVLTNPDRPRTQNAAHEHRMPHD